MLSFLLFYDFGFCLRSFFRQWAQRLQLSQPVQPQLLCRIKARTAKNSAVPMAASSRMSQIFTAALRSRGSQRQPPTQSNTATAPVRQPTCRPVPAARRPPPPRRGVYSRLNTSSDPADSGDKMLPMVPPNRTSRVETTLSLAIKPLIRAVQMRQSPRPRGANSGTRMPDIRAKMLSAESDTILSCRSSFVGTIPPPWQ